MRAVTYASYSRNLPSAASIEDQNRVCRELIEQEKGTIVDICADYAISGGSVRNWRQRSLLNSHDGQQRRTGGLFSSDQSLVAQPQFRRVFVAGRG